jgi:hypothetical protein
MNIKEIKLVCPEIKNWYFTEEPSSNPFALDALLWGEVYGNPRFEDGTRIHTSRVRYFVREDEDSILVKTRNSTYRIRREETNMYGREEDEKVWENLLKVCVRDED